MSIELLRSAFLWCAVLNYVVLLVWFLIFVLSHTWLYRLCSRWFRLTSEQFDAINLGGIVVYKAAILLLNLVPYLALRILG
jgi:hypothetical protein